MELTWNWIFTLYYNSLIQYIFRQFYVQEVVHKSRHDRTVKDFVLKSVIISGQGGVKNCVTSLMYDLLKANNYLQLCVALKWFMMYVYHYKTSKKRVRSNVADAIDHRVTLTRKSSWTSTNCHTSASKASRTRSHWPKNVVPTFTTQNIRNSSSDASNTFTLDTFSIWQSLQTPSSSLLIWWDTLFLSANSYTTENKCPC